MAGVWWCLGAWGLFRLVGYRVWAACITCRAGALRSPSVAGVLNISRCFLSLNSLGWWVAMSESVCVTPPSPRGSFLVLRGDGKEQGEWPEPGVSTPFWSPVPCHPRYPVASSSALMMGDGPRNQNDGLGDLRFLLF